MASKVIVDISMSSDGFVRAAHPTPDEPMGLGGERLHQWFFATDDERNREVMESGAASLGALIAGRRTYDDSVKWWGADGPTGPARRPLIVLTHQAPEDSPADGVYTFVTDGLHEALTQARAAAGGQDIAIMGGPNVVQQFLAAGLVDEVSLHIVPVLFGTGAPLLGGVAGPHIELEPVEIVQTAAAAHARYRVKRDA